LAYKALEISTIVDTFTGGVVDNEAYKALEISTIVDNASLISSVKGL